MSRAAAELSFVERMEIIKACERLQLDYAHAGDFNLLDMRGAQFAPDAEMHLWGRVYAGQPAIREFLLNRDPTLATMHSLSNSRVDVVSEDEAEGSVYVTASVGKVREGAAPLLTTVIRGAYLDSYRKVDGEWKIAKRVVKDFLAPQTVS